MVRNIPRDLWQLEDRKAGRSGDFVDSEAQRSRHIVYFHSVSLLVNGLPLNVFPETHQQK